ncbi:HET-domain-containing protein [Pyrenochaeta sp. DS3sAY3a]|nr:HET-domain-containing protein [Pyrenochaeta sp. DS3sAY3a]
MYKKHDRTDDNDIRPCWDEPRPSKHVKRGEFETHDTMNPAHRLMPGQLSHVYPQRLEAGAARILVLCPGSGDDEIKCKLRHKELPTQGFPDEASSYEALSYVWGIEIARDPIFLCGSRFPVTRNLAEALKGLRLPKVERMLWVDAICINQYDEKEKELQVKLMHMIYKLAKRVIAWLGSPYDASDSAFDTMEMQSDLPSISAALSFRIGGEKNDNEYGPFEQLMRRPYWSRAWIVQEMMLARSLVIQCGSRVVSYSTLEKVYPNNRQAHFSIEGDESTPRKIHFRGDSEQRILRMETEELSCESFLDCYLDRQCLKRHDNIFAFYNLLSDKIQGQIPVCYGKEIKELVLGTFRSFIETMESLYVITIRGRQRPPSAHGDDSWQLAMPSWCPYLATPYKCRSIQPQHKPSLFTEKPNYSFVQGKLRVEGFIIGKVSQTISRRVQPRVEETSWWHPADVDQELKHLRKCVALGLVGMPNDLPTERMCIEATSRTLLAGRPSEVSGLEIFASEMGAVEEPVIGALREIWNNGRCRLTRRCDLCDCRMPNTGCPS